jgi:hypothetical protein
MKDSRNPQFDASGAEPDEEKEGLRPIGDRKNFLTLPAILRYFRASTVDRQPELPLRAVNQLQKNRKLLSNLGPSVRV